MLLMSELYTDNTSSVCETDQHIYRDNLGGGRRQTFGCSSWPSGTTESVVLGSATWFSCNITTGLNLKERLIRNQPDFSLDNAIGHEIRHGKTAAVPRATICRKHAMVLLRKVRCGFSIVGIPTEPTQGILWAYLWTTLSLWSWFSSLHSTGISFYHRRARRRHP